MKNTFITCGIGLVLLGCQTVDVLEVVNPNLAEESVLGQPNSAAIWLEGCERQLTLSLNYLAPAAEIASDNYQNTNTFYNQFLDQLVINQQDSDINLAHRAVGRLRETARYGLNVIGPADANYTPAIEAEYEFYLGIANLWGGEYFLELPGEPLGPLLPRTAHLEAAVAAFSRSLTINAQNTAALMGRARAHYRLGNREQAVADAQAAIAADPNFLRLVRFDPVNTAGNRNGFNYTKNDLQLAISERGNFDDLQPKPYLDFLDPKLPVISATEDSPIPLLKIEEAHLIIAEALHAQGNLPGVRTKMKEIVALVNTRPTRTFNDATEDRTQRAPGSRPDSTDVIVDGREGLVLYRKGGPVTVPVISGTSFDDEFIDDIADQDLLARLYLLRQEIFIAEARRIVDMGVTYVISEIEALQNPNIGADAPATQANIPPFINAVRTQLDAFTYERDARPRTATSTVDVNRIIADNSASDRVCPFH